MICIKNIRKKQQKSYKTHLNFEDQNLGIKLLFEKKLRFTKQIEIESYSLPIQSRHYIPIYDSFQIYEYNEYNLMNLVIDKISPKKMNKLDKLTLERLKRDDLKEDDNIITNEIHKIEFISKGMLGSIGLESPIINILSKILKKKPAILQRFVDNIYVPSELKDNKKQFKNIVVSPRTDYVELLCSICYVYLCRIHTSIYKDTTAQDFQNLRYYSRNRKHNDDVLVNNYSCNSCNSIDFTTANIINKIDNKQESNQNFELTQWQLEFIKNFCINYNLSHPCIVRHLIDYKNSCSSLYKVIKELNVKPIQNQLKVIKQRKLIKKDEYFPCYHYDGKCDQSNCYCLQGFGYCDKYCGCDLNCVHRFPGCSCGPNMCQVSLSCFCIENHIECDSERCKKCCSDINIRIVKDHSKFYCPNTAATYHLKTRLLVGKSNICGLGIFAGQVLLEHEFIGEYIGEFINRAEREKRMLVYELIDNSYLFEIPVNQVKISILM